jgi:hypothetical protein
MLDKLNGDDVMHGHWPPRPAIPRLAPPVVEVRRIRHPHGDLLLIPRCVYCGKKHVHGAGSKADCGDHGHRVSHCYSGPRNRGYYLYEPCEQQPPPPTRGRQQRRRR